MRRQIIILALVAFFSAGGGAVTGYAFGRGNQEPLAGLSELPGQYTAAASALQMEILPDRHVLDETVEYENSRPRYLLSTDRGFVAVFNLSDDMELTLRERTRTPESALATDERERLSKGIYLYTEEQLLRALQDYGS